MEELAVDAGELIKRPTVLGRRGVSEMAAVEPLADLAPVDDCLVFVLVLVHEDVGEFLSVEPRALGVGDEEFDGGDRASVVACSGAESFSESAHAEVVSPRSGAWVAFPGGAFVIADRMCNWLA
ncbi:hypothetical protein [Nonomuraea sp. NPDC052265]|uniref:hypothetical protein n=1 Tax=Nonomuraea sp. NPDC052265 TaxID=3364374 RepID=UPI0037CAA972